MPAPRNVISALAALLLCGCPGEKADAGGVSCYQDLDEDGYGDPRIRVLGCGPLAADNADDCDDDDAAVYTGAVELCGDGVDSDCDEVDETTQPDCVAPDLDGDGHTSASSGGDDCDDGSAAIYPGAEERCDGRDDDCDGEIDEDLEALADLDGLAALTNIGGDLRVVTAPTLTDVEGLGSLSTIGGELYLGELDALTGLDGLEALTTVGGAIDLVDMLALQDISSLSGVYSVGDPGAGTAKIYILTHPSLGCESIEAVVDIIDANILSLYGVGLSRVIVTGPDC